MGNKHTIPENAEDKKIFLKEIKHFINEDKTSYNYISDLRKDHFQNTKKKKSCVNQKSNLKDIINSKAVIDHSLELFSILTNATLNHEVNATIYKAVTIAKIGDDNVSLSKENDFDTELIGNQASLLIEWIYTTYLSNKKVNYDNWTPVIDKSGFALNNLEDNYSSIHADDDYSQLIENKDLSFEKDNNGNPILNTQGKYVAKKNKLKKKKLNINISSKSKENLISLPSNKNIKLNTPTNAGQANSTSATGNKKAKLVTLNNLNSPEVSSNKKTSIIDKNLKSEKLEKTVNSILNHMNKKISNAAINQIENARSNEINLNTNSNNNANTNTNANNYTTINQPLNNEESKTKEFKLNENSNKADNFEVKKNNLFAFHTFKPEDNILNNSKTDKKDVINTINEEINRVKLNKEKNLLQTNKLSSETFKITESRSENKITTESKLKKEIKSDNNKSSKKLNSQSNQLVLQSDKKKSSNNFNYNYNFNVLQKEDFFSPNADKEKNFADLVLRNVSPLRSPNKKFRNDIEHMKLFVDSDDEDKKIKVQSRKKYIKKKENEYIDRGAFTTTTNFQKFSKTERNIFGKNKPVKKLMKSFLNPRKTRIRIDVRTLLEEIENDRYDSSRSSTMNQINERSKSRDLIQMNQLNLNLGNKTTTQSLKLLPEIEKLTRKKSQTAFKKSQNGLSSKDLKLKSIDVDNNFGDLSNQNQISHNVNHHNNLNHSSGTINPYHKKLSQLPSKKKLTFNSSKKKSTMLLNFRSFDTLPPSRIDVNEVIGNIGNKFIYQIDFPKFNLDLTPLNNKLPYEQILKLFKENNKFLFEITNEEKNLNEKFKSFNYEKVLSKE